MKHAQRTLGLALAMAFGLAALSDAGAGEKKSPATTSMNRDNQRHKQFLEVAKKGDIDVLFIGDSITQGWEGAKGGRNVWKMHYEPLKAANFGIGGDQTGHVLWRLTEGKELEGISPKVTVLMIGTNNTGRDGAEEIADGIKLVVKTIHQKLPKTKVLLLAVFPRDKTGMKFPDKIGDINKIIAKLDDGGKTVKYLDIGPKFLSKEGKLTTEIMYDLLHLTPSGYQIWAESMNPTLQALLKK